jgi:hypothetical protein
MDELIEWLLAQINEDETVACAVAARKWSRYIEGGDDGWAIESEPPGCDFIVGDDGAARHIARFDPKRMLDEVAAKRKIIGLVTDAGPSFGDGYTEAYRDVVKLVALPYDQRPGFREGWRP